MLDTELSELIQKLDNETQLALEDAVACAFNRAHPATTLEHWLSQLITQPMGTVVQQQIPVSTLQQLLDKLLQGKPSKHSGPPVLAAELVQTVRRAWLTVSLQPEPKKMTLKEIITAMLSTELELYWSEGIKHELVQLEIELNENPNAEPLINDSSLILQRYTQDLTKAAGEGKIDPVIGREQEIHNLITVLLRRRQNNPILVGEAGVGKTAVAEGFALAISQKQVPTNLQNSRVLAVDLAALQAGAGTKGEFERRLQEFVKAVQSAKTPIILFIDEVHNLIGAGNQQGKGDAANLLKPLLARGELRTIAATTWSEYKQYIEPDPALTRRFQLIPINEPSSKEAEIILRGLQPKLAQHHQVMVLDEAISAAVELSERYINDKQLPDKALSLLDSACAQVKLSHVAVPLPLQKLDAKIQSEQSHVEHLKHETQFGYDHGKEIQHLSQENSQLTQQKQDLETNWSMAKEYQHAITALQTEMKGTDRKQRSKLIKSIKTLRKKLNEVNRTEVYQLPCVDKITVANVIAAWTGIPVNRMLADSKEQMRYVRQQLFKRVIGQDIALTELANRVDISLAQLHDPNKPLGVFLLCGSSGVGKTETALALAEALHGSERQLITLNMSEFKEAHKVSQLLGSPAGYVGYGEGGSLTEAVRKKPYSILLLDELEKSHTSVQELFYQVFDKGTLTDSTGTEVNFKNTLILMTTNVASDVLLQTYQTQQLPDNYSALVDLASLELQQHFKPAFLGRVTVLPYLPLNNESLMNIAEGKMAKVKQRYQQYHGKELKIDPLEIQALVNKCQRTDQGARMVDKLIEKKMVEWIVI